MKLLLFFSLVGSILCAALALAGCGGLSMAKPSEIPAMTTPMAVSVPVDSNAYADAEDKLISKTKASVAPELVKGEWINSEALTLAGLKGNVVYIEFWTFGCYNCINTLPAVKGYDKKFREKGLTVIGIETPEFDSERVLGNLAAAVKKQGIEYPVLTDYGSKNWENYNVNAWPTIVIVDKQGRVRYRHVGEGAYDTQEKVIETLLAE